MQYGICNETFGNWPLKRVCEFAADAGYTGIEIAPFTLGENHHELSSNQRGDLRRIIAQAGLECIGLHWLLAKTDGLHVTSPDAETRSRTISYLTDLARLCRDLGGKTLVFGSPQQRSLMADVTKEDAHLFLQEVFGALVPVLEETDTVLALEPLAPIETDVLTTADETRGLIDLIGSPHIRLHLDVKAMASEDQSIPEIIHASAVHLEHFHANDINLQGPGFGAIDFAPIFRALHEISYSGWVSVEVFDYALGAERLARESIQYMQQVEADIE